MTLPYDILRFLSYHLPPKHLSINKEMRDMYNEPWFRDTLQFLHPSLKLYTSTNYYDLYKKYERQGTIMYYDLSVHRYYLSACLVNKSYDICLRTQGIKAVQNYILTFNGDVYLETDEVILIDTEVIDISYVYNEIIYIKKDKVYLLNSVIIHGKDFIKVDRWYVLASNGIYYITEDESFEFLPLMNTLDMCITRDINIVTTKNGDNYTFYYDEPHALEYTHYILNPHRGIFNRDGQPIRIVSGYNADKVHAILFQGVIQKHYRFDDIQFILSNNTLHLVEIGGKICISYSNIKDCYHSESRMYIIK